jgi:hypothetical protein
MSPEERLAVHILGIILTPVCAFTIAMGAAFSSTVATLPEAFGFGAVFGLPLALLAGWRLGDVLEYDLRNKED